MDKYTKFILTLIAVGIIGLNYNLGFKFNIISEVQAADPDLAQIELYLKGIVIQLSNLVDETHQVWRVCERGYCS